MNEPLSLGTVTPKKGRNFRWTILAFVLCGLLMAGLAIWQLAGLSPSLYCRIDGKQDCTQLLIALLGVKDNALIATFMILGLTVLSVVAVALGVSVKATGPGGTSVDIGHDPNAPPPTVISQGDKQIVVDPLAE